MRFIIHEQPTETLLAAGAYRYEQNGRPTGAVESWRLTQVAPGYQALRVDLDARDADSGHTYLYHFVRQTNGRPERLTYRFWGAAHPLGSLQIEGKLIFSDADVIGTHVLNGRSTEIDLPLPAGCTLWFPSVVGLGLAAGAAGPNPAPGLTLQNQVGGEETLLPRLVSFQAQPQPAHIIDVQVGRRTVSASSTTITWDTHRRVLALDAHAWPLTMTRADDGEAPLSAVATRLIRYQQEKGDAYA